MIIDTEEQKQEDRIRFREYIRDHRFDSQPTYTSIIKANDLFCSLDAHEMVDHFYAVLLLSGNGSFSTGMGMRSS